MLSFHVSRAFASGPEAKEKRDFVRRFRLLPLSLLLAIASPPHSRLTADPGSRMHTEMLRAGRWNALQQYFQNNAPREPSEKYALARSLESDRDASPTDRNGNRALATYLSLLGVSCNNTLTEGDLIACTSSLAPDSRESLMERLALYRASSLAHTMGFSQLELRLLLLAGLGTNDPLSRTLYANRLQRLVQGNDVREAVRQAELYPSLVSPLDNFWRARAELEYGRKDRALQLYLKAAADTTQSWIHQSIYLDLKKGYPSLFSPGNGSYPPAVVRALTPLSHSMRTVERYNLRRVLTTASLMQSSSPEMVRADGLFLIESGQYDDLPRYATAAYTHLFQNPDILYDWAAVLYREKRYATLQNLFRIFDHAKEQNQGLWRIYLGLLAKTGSRDAYFDGMLAYLKKNQSDYSVYDDLLEFLIGDDHQHVHWAAAPFWERARTALPPRGEKGRFLYWLRRYYHDTGNESAARAIEENFYAMAPGSYYAQAFWDEKKGGDWVSAWGGVRDRESYLSWISRYGGNSEALQFLSHQDVRPYLDPKAMDFWNRFRSVDFSIPAEILTLYRLGENQIANDFYKDHYSGTISELENLARLAYIGHETGNLYLSVYYTRGLARYLDVPEDPFSMPEELLKRLYPRPYLPYVRKYSHLYGIPEEMVYGLMRQESVFRETAVSHSGAAGLMQIMPRTGSWLARSLKIRAPDYFEPEISIQFGSKYFADLLKQYNGDFRWASIAYNGGPGNLHKWKRLYYRGDFNLFLENIPIAEPRNYCRITYQNYLHYHVTYAIYR